MCVETATPGPSAHRLSLSELCESARPFSDAEVAAILSSIVRAVEALHQTSLPDGRIAAHGNLTLSSINIGAGLEFLELSAACCAAHSRCAACMAPEDRVKGTSSQAGDIWSIGVIGVQLLLGRECAFAQSGGHCRGLVDRCSGELPVMPCGVSFEGLDFLMECLALRPEDRPSASDLNFHAYFRMFAGSNDAHVQSKLSSNEAAALDLMHNEEGDLGDLSPFMMHLLISDDLKFRPPPCRPHAVPSLSAPIWEIRVCFETPSHTARCNRCRLHKMDRTSNLDRNSHCSHFDHEPLARAACSPSLNPGQLPAAHGHGPLGEPQMSESEESDLESAALPRSMEPVLQHALGGCDGAEPRAARPGRVCLPCTVPCEKSHRVRTACGGGVSPDPRTDSPTPPDSSGCSPRGFSRADSRGALSAPPTKRQRRPSLQNCHSEAQHSEVQDCSVLAHGFVPLRPEAFGVASNCSAVAPNCPTAALSATVPWRTDSVAA